MNENLKLHRFFRPVLEALEDGSSKTRGELSQSVIQLLRLTPEEAALPTTKGDKTKVYDRVHWSAYYLSRAGLVTLANSRFSITDEGKQYLHKHAGGITKTDLLTFPSFQDFISRSGGTKSDKGSTQNDATSDTLASIDSGLTPTEQIEHAQKQIDDEVCAELLERIKSKEPAFFEHLVVGLLVRMGYDGSFTDAASVVGRSGDGGIDGVIKEDRLGLDKIYVQAKRWQGKVGEPEVRNFVGSLAGRGATKGVFITTSSFQENVSSFLLRVPATVILINGDELARLCLEHNIGVTCAKTVLIKRIDADYFD